MSPMTVVGIGSHIAGRLGPGNYRRIAAGSGLTPQHVGRVLRGARGASLHVASRIAQAAGVSLDEMYGYILRQPELRIRGRRTVRDKQQRTRRRAS